MWESIGLVSGGFTLIAFLSASVVWVFRRKVIEKERLIKLASEEDRAALVNNALEFFGIDTSRLSPRNQYDLALQQIHARARRFSITAIVIVILALLAAVLSGIALTRSDTQPIPSKMTLLPGAKGEIFSSDNSRSLAITLKKIEVNPSTSDLSCDLRLESPGQISIDRSGVEGDEFTYNGYGITIDTLVTEKASFFVTRK